MTRQNFSSPNQYNIKQTSDENKEKYPLGEYKLIHYQIHRPSIIKKSMADSKEKYSCDFGSERVNTMVSISPNVHSDIVIIQLKMTEVWSKQNNINIICGIKLS